MRLLTDQRAREILAHPHINITKVALSYYGVDAGNLPPGKTPTNYSNALRNVTINRPPGKIRPDVLEKLTITIAPLWGIMAEVEQQFI
jgi:hypothetical protein